MNKVVNNKNFKYYFLQEVIPNELIAFCENLKKLIEILGIKDNQNFEISLETVIEFIKKYPEKWDYLFKI